MITNNINKNTVPVHLALKFKAHLEQKYAGLYLYDKNYDSRLLTCTKIHFHKTRGNNRYCIFAVMDGYDPEKG